MANKITGGEAQAGSFRALGGDAIDKFLIGTANVNPGSIASVTRGTIAVPMTGAKVGDFVGANPPAALEAGLLYVGAYVSAANEVTIMLYNLTGGAVDGAARDWTLFLISERG